MIGPKILCLIFFNVLEGLNWTFQLFKDLVYFSSKPKDIQCQNYYKLKLIHIECFVDIWLLIGSSFKRIRLEKYRWLIFLKQCFVCCDWVLLQFQEIFRFSPQLPADAFILSLAINPQWSDPTIWNTEPSYSNERYDSVSRKQLDGFQNAFNTK